MLYIRGILTYPHLLNYRSKYTSSISWTLNFICWEVRTVIQHNWTNFFLVKSCTCGNIRVDSTPQIFSHRPPHSHFPWWSRYKNAKEVLCTHWSNNWTNPKCSWQTTSRAVCCSPCQMGPSAQWNPSKSPSPLGTRRRIRTSSHRRSLTSPQWSSMSTGETTPACHHAKWVCSHWGQRSAVSAVKWPPVCSSSCAGQRSSARDMPCWMCIWNVRLFVPGTSCTDRVEYRVYDTRDLAPHLRLLFHQRKWPGRMSQKSGRGRVADQMAYLCSSWCPRLQWRTQTDCRCHHWWRWHCSLLSNQLSLQTDTDSTTWWYVAVARSIHYRHPMAGASSDAYTRYSHPIAGASSDRGYY